MIYKGRHIDMKDIFPQQPTTEGMKKGFSLVEQQMIACWNSTPRYIMRERCGSCKEYASDNSFLWMYPCAECRHMHKLGGEQIIGHWEMTYEEVEKEVPYLFFWTTKKMVKIEKKVWVVNIDAGFSDLHQNVSKIKLDDSRDFKFDKVDGE